MYSIFLAQMNCFTASEGELMSGVITGCGDKDFETEGSA